ncbi:uncharacterized protein LOC119027011 isoform X3 [Acanthopagrus latus]|uniref:uncharacterized protein LOC119027011 isoform X3 n=1 Tax=Acanthopagrus latus TaxID=8177 RepID=UPI00187C11F7|nr:uncharacterized protein LOC119027011 isoform X3 [Acanthopagrus latus]
MASLLLFSLFSLISGISGIFVILGDTFEFPKTASCQKKGAQLWHPLDSSRNVLVARWDGVWIPSQYYEDRIDLNASVVLRNINFNDNGLFELSCEEAPTQLDVVRASEVSVSAGGAVSFSFFYVTSGAQGMFRLDRNRETVCELDLSSGTITDGTGSEERFSLPSDWRRRGDLTPTLQRVKPEDQGDYFAYVEGNDGKRRGLSAWRVKVLDQDPDQTTATPGTSGGGMKTWIIVIITAAVTSGPWALLCWFLVWWLKFRRPNVSPGPDGGELNVGLLTNGNPAGPQTNGGPQVQNLIQSTENQMESTATT